MPQFQLDHGTPAAAERFRKLDSFTQGYIEAMFFTDASSSDDGDLADATVHDLAPETWELIEKDCAAFQTDNADALAQAYDFCIRNGYDESRAGNDYWYTRNGHGTGFWDRGLGEPGDRLAAASRYHEVNPYLGDDGLIYLD